MFPYVDDVSGQVSSVDARYADAMAAINDGPAKENGRRLGAEVADDILAWRENDGFDNAVPYV